MVKFLFILHRYLGIAIGLVMLLWTVSGVIMMYKHYPELNLWESLAQKESIDLTDCCQLPVSQLTRGEEYSLVQLEMLNGEPVLRLHTLDRGIVSYDLACGSAFNSVDLNTARAIAENYVQDRYAGSLINDSYAIQNDQWTVYSNFNSHRPLFKFELGDAAATEFYISSRSGGIVQLTTADQRLWGYLGAVLHWLYPTLLRQNTALWAQVVIWLTIAGIFLTVTGLYIGIRQYRKRNSGKLSPYQGIPLYHHCAGLIFGVLTLTWVTSGLLSMNPWGVLEGEGIAAEYQRLTERTLNWNEVELVLSGLNPSTLDPAIVQLDISVMAGGTSVIAYQADGAKQRLHPSTLQPHSHTMSDLESLAEKLQPGATILSTQLIDSEDSYYYVHHEPKEFPAFRVIIDDSQKRHYYLSPVDGQILLKVDEESRWYRWLFYGIHRGDFSVLTRSRPLWDSFMLLFLIGVTVVCGTGSYMGIKRLRRDLSTKRKLEAEVIDSSI